MQELPEGSLPSRQLTTHSREPNEFVSGEEPGGHSETQVPSGSATVGSAQEIQTLSPVGREKQALQLGLEQEHACPRELKPLRQGRSGAHSRPKDEVPFGTSPAGHEATQVPFTMYLLLRHEVHTSPEREGPESVNEHTLQLVSGQALGLPSMLCGAVVILLLLQTNGGEQKRPNSLLTPTRE